MNNFGLYLYRPGLLALFAVVWAGWVRLGWSWPVPASDFVLIHGPLLVLAFLGTLIALERAAALQQRGGTSGL